MNVYLLFSARLMYKREIILSVLFVILLKIKNSFPILLFYKRLGKLIRD